MIGASDDWVLIVSMVQLLIASGQYVVSELFAEFGGIPPAFLPLGNQRLYVHQVRHLQQLYPRICLTLPSDFDVDPADAAVLAQLEVGVYDTPSFLTLGAAMHDALEAALKEVVADGTYDKLVAKWKLPPTVSPFK